MGGKGSGDASRLPKGRPKGTKNKFTSLKQDYIEAYQRRGGVEFLMSLDDREFATSLAKLLPREISADVKGEQNITVNIISSGEGKKK